MTRVGRPVARLTLTDEERRTLEQWARRKSSTAMSSFVSRSCQRASMSQNAASATWSKAPERRVWPSWALAAKS